MAVSTGSGGGSAWWGVPTLAASRAVFTEVSVFVAVKLRAHAGAVCLLGGAPLCVRARVRGSLCERACAAVLLCVGAVAALLLGAGRGGAGRDVGPGPRGAGGHGRARAAHRAEPARGRGTQRAPARACDAGAGQRQPCGLRWLGSSAGHAHHAVQCGPGALSAGVCSAPVLACPSCTGDDVGWGKAAGFVRVTSCRVCVLGLVWWAWAPLRPPRPVCVVRASVHPLPWHGFHLRVCVSVCESVCVSVCVCVCVCVCVWAYGVGRVRAGQPATAAPPCGGHCAVSQCLRVPWQPLVQAWRVGRVHMIPSPSPSHHLAASTSPPPATHKHKTHRPTAGARHCPCPGHVAVRLQPPAPVRGPRPVPCACARRGFHLQWRRVAG
jgi:hypothetical protein